MSYRREDSAGWAGRLVQDLSEKFGAENVFQDIHGITPGVDFVDAIDETLQQADCALVVIGPSWLTTKSEAVAAGRSVRRLDNPDDHVRRELATALRRGVPIVPVLVGGARMPASDQLPEDVRALARRNAAELSDKRWSYDLDQLAQAIARLQLKGSQGGPGAPTAGASASPPVRRRKQGLVLAGVLLAAAIFTPLFALVWRPWDSPPQPRSETSVPSGQDGAVGTPRAPAVTDTALVVFGADVSVAAARPEVERAKRAGFTSATIYRRQGSYRGVVEFPSQQVANEALPRIRALSRAASGAYVRQLSAWCPNGTRSAEGFTECP